MKLLAFDTSTEVLSVALAWPAGGHARVARHTGPGGASASASLIPVIQSLLQEAQLRPGDLDAIVFGRGPGSFTGLRTACSVAQGLALGSGAAVLPVDTLLAVAEEARERSGVTRVVAALDARMDEVYCASYEFGQGQWRAVDEVSLRKPEAVQVPAGWSLAGNAAGAYPGRIAVDARCVIEALPTAQALLRLAPALLAAGHGTTAAGALPLYVRDKVAKTTAERAAIAAAASTA